MDPKIIAFHAIGAACIAHSYRLFNQTEHSWPKKQVALEYVSSLILVVMLVVVGHWTVLGVLAVAFAPIEKTIANRREIVVLRLFLMLMLFVGLLLIVEKPERELNGVDLAAYCLAATATVAAYWHHYGYTVADARVALGNLHWEARRVVQSAIAGAFLIAMVLAIAFLAKQRLG